jgi:hypothetical protein
MYLLILLDSCSTESIKEIYAYIIWEIRKIFLERYNYVGSISSYDRSNIVCRVIDQSPVIFDLIWEGE